MFVCKRGHCFHVAALTWPAPWCVTDFNKCSSIFWFLIYMLRSTPYVYPIGLASGIDQGANTVPSAPTLSMLKCFRDTNKCDFVRAELEISSFWRNLFHWLFLKFLVHPVTNFRQIDISVSMIWEMKFARSNLDSLYFHETIVMLEVVMCAISSVLPHNYHIKLFGRQEVTRKPCTTDCLFVCMAILSRFDYPTLKIY